ncbi:D-lactate dehydrogenase [Phytopseudomonas daroniae]|uniref:D-lactate dehydrogenase n=1 Tax=Phytopseudomonas daroniae TaxID=2487519 RepID=UPI0010385132|nr:D-lactate dehydrogenase [Pseudomonas daroniae]TBU78463.1 D-lactate dehydrogenase [Pseudomonas daroniae]
MQQSLTLQRLGELVGSDNLITDDYQKAYYCKGFRYGRGEALAVVLPQTLLQLWSVLNVCQQGGVIILMQAANTGVTGGSTPQGDDYDRPVVIISTRKIKGMQVIDDARQIIAFPGSTLTELEDGLKPYGREPHSVIGSSCIGASVVGGICNNSGGSLLQRGPAFTEKSLFARITEDGNIELVNHLGIELGDTPEQMISSLETGRYSTGTASDWAGKIWADDYYAVIKDVDAQTPTRFNGNPQYLYESSGCAGKVIVFAVRLATFEAVKAENTFYIGTDDEQELLSLRRFLIENLDHLPVQAEYIDRSAFRLTLRYARHMYLSIKRLGPAALPGLMQKKAMWDARVKRLKLLPANMIDRLIQWGNRLIPANVAPRLLSFHQRFEHHLMIKVDRSDTQQLNTLLSSFFAERSGDWFQCSDTEQADAFLIRFAVGGAAIFYCDYHGIDGDSRLISLDVALRRNDDHWMIQLPAELKAQVLEETCCGHFFCLVNHQDYILKPGVDGVKFKAGVLEHLDQRGAKYPAEHNIGHLYQASEEHRRHFVKLDPTNTCNPGIGRTSKLKHWA